MAKKKEAPIRTHKDKVADREKGKETNSNPKTYGKKG